MTRRRQGPSLNQVAFAVKQAHRAAKLVPPPPPRRYGRPGYPLELLLSAHIAGMGSGIRSPHHLAQELKTNKQLRGLCGFEEQTPCVDTLLHFRRRVADDPLLERITRELEQLLFSSSTAHENPGDAGQERDDIARLDAVLAVVDDRDLLISLNRSGSPGRNGYDPAAMWRAYFAFFVLEIPDLAQLWRTLRNDRELAEWCGFYGEIPHRTTFSRFVGRLADRQDALEDILSALKDELHDRLPSYGRGVAVDSTAVPAYANGNRNPPADPDARWGLKTANRSKESKEWYYGYKLHLATCATTGLQLAWELTPANLADGPEMPKVLEDARRRHPWLRPDWVAADRGYDSSSNTEYIVGLGALPVILARDDAPKDADTLSDGTPICACGGVMEFVSLSADGSRHLWRCPHGGVMGVGGRRICSPDPIELDWRDNPRRTPPLPRATREFRRLYATRTASERLNALLKDRGPLRAPRHRGHHKVSLLMRMSMLWGLSHAVAMLRAGEPERIRQRRVAAP